MADATIRFAVADDAAGLHSAAWRLWQNTHGDVYLVRRASGHLHKISLHQSRICRYAESKDHAGEARKADIRWERPVTPSIGLTYAVTISVPTSYLGASSSRLPGKILRIPPASMGRATMVGVFFTRGGSRYVAEQLGTAARLLSDTPMPSGEFCGIACFNHADWRDFDIVVPASGYEDRELRFTAVLPEAVDRTFSLTIPMRPDNEGSPLRITEWYGYAAVPGTPCVPLTEPHGILSRSGRVKVWTNPAAASPSRRDIRP